MAYDSKLGYDPDFDYAAAMQTESDPNKKKKYIVERTLKIANMTGQQAASNNVDVQDAINQAQSAGVDQSTINRLNDVRNQKIAGANDQQLKEWGVQKPPVATTTSTPDAVSYIDFYDEAGNLQRVRSDQAANVPGTWSRTKPVEKTNLGQKVTQAQERVSNAAPVVDNSAKITDMYEQQKNSQLAAIRQALGRARGGYEQTIANTPQQFVPLRNQVDEKRARAIQQAKEVMANSGNYKGGDNITAQVAINSGADSDINDLNTKQAEIIANAQKAINELEASGSFEEARAVADIATQKINALINEANRVSDQGYAREQNNFGNTMSVANFLNGLSQQGFQNGLSLAGLTGNYGGQRTLQGQEFDMNKDVTEAGLTGMYKGNPTLVKQQQDIDNQYRQGVFDWQKQTTLWDQAFRQGQFDYQKARESVSDEQWGKEYQLKLDEFTWSRSANNPAVLAQILQNQINDEQLRILRDPYSPENQMKWAQIDQLRKQTEQIGKQPARTPEEIEMDKVKLDTAKEQLNQIRNPQPDQTEVGNYWAASALNQLNALPDMRSKQKWLNEHAQEIIQNAGTPTYNFLKNQVDSIYP